jgi:hypothetical protein
MFDVMNGETLRFPDFEMEGLLLPVNRACLWDVSQSRKFELQGVDNRQAKQ